MAKTKYKNVDEVRKAVINFSLSNVEKQSIVEKAESMGISMSAYIRYKLFYENKKA